MFMRMLTRRKLKLLNDSMRAWREEFKLLESNHSKYLKQQALKHTPSALRPAPVGQVFSKCTSPATSPTSKLQTANNSRSQLEGTALVSGTGSSCSNVDDNAKNRQVQEDKPKG